MSYEIDGKRISRWSRSKLLAMLEQTDQDRLKALSSLGTHRMMEERQALLVGGRDMAIADRDAARMELAQAEAALVVARKERDQYKHEAVDYWCRLTAAETAISQREADIATRDRELEAAWDKFEMARLVAIAFGLGLGIAILGMTVWH